MTYSREEVEAARERLVSVEELTEELRWHVHFDDDDEQVPCNICGSDDVPCIVERLALDWRNAHAHIEALETENERLRRFVREVLYDYLEIDKSSQCPWCLWIPGRSWQPIHECSAIEMIQAVGLRALLPEARDA